MEKIRKSGVNRNLYSDYNFEEHIWYKNKPDFDDYLKMAEYCVHFDRAYWIKDPSTGLWSDRGSIYIAQREMENLFLNASIGNTIVDSKFIESFFTGKEERQVQVGKKIINTKETIGSCPNLDATTCLPFCANKVIFNGKKQLNTWVDSAITPNPKYINYGKIILRLIYRSLCNGAELDPDHLVEENLLLKQIVEDKITNLDFRKVVYFLASLYQRPGYNCLINLWFCGVLEGLGKGTVVTVIGRCVGENLVTTLNVGEIEAGWDDHVIGKILIEGNEIDCSTGRKGGWSAKQWGNWIKSKCNEPTVSFRERNFGTHHNINIGNYIFTTNNENPVYLSATDRRNQMIKTTDDPKWVVHAAEIQERLIKPKLDQVAAGFAEILMQVTIDDAFLNKAHVNEFKAEIQAQSVDVIEEWIKTDINIARKVGMLPHDLYTVFKEWCREYSPEDQNTSLNRWGRSMTNLARLKKCGVSELYKPGGKQYMISDVIKAEIVDKEAVASELSKSIGEQSVFVDYDIVPKEVIADMTGVSKIAKLRAKLKVEEAKRDR